MYIKDSIVKIIRSNLTLHKTFKFLIRWRDYYKIHKKIVNTKEKEWFLVLTPNHGNLGDHAIAKAEIELLKKCQISYTELSGGELSVLSSLNKMHLLNGKPIMINGGGNLGTLWIDVEKLIRNVINNNPDSEIIIMPSTIYYDDIKKFYKSAKIYNAHNKLRIYARESISYDMMKDVYHHVELVPDMVLSLNACNKKVGERQGCLLCLRSDCEKTMTDADVQEITDILKNYFDDIKQTDTVLKCSVSCSERNSRLEEKFLEFSKAKLVITDRLHGMIFSVITGTPCIVLNSKSPKLKGCYKWIQDLGYTFFLDKTDSFQDSFKKAIQSCLQLENCKYDNNFLKEYFEKIENAIIKIQEEA